MKRSRLIGLNKVSEGKNMGWTESESVCKKHPTHKQHQGVCPSCLRERLSHLCASSRRDTSIVVVPSFSSSPYYSSSSTGSGGRHSRNPSVGTLMSSLMVSGGNGLKKSRSIAFMNPRSVVDENGKKKKKKTTTTMTINRSLFR